MAFQGDGAWEPRCGEKRAPAVAHGTHQNQYTKRRALLNCTSNHTSSNNDSDDNMVGSEDGTQRDRQHGHFAETGFAAQTSAGSDGKGVEQVKGSSVATQNADSGKAEATLMVGESGVLSRQQSSGRLKGRAHVSSDESKKSQRRKQNLRDADASSGGKLIPKVTHEIPGGSAQPHRRKDISAHTGNRASRTAASTAPPVAARAVTDGLPSGKSGEAEEGLTDGAGVSAEMRASAPGAAVDQSATATKSGEDVMHADQGLAQGTRPARLQSDPTEAATSSGAPFQKPLLITACLISYSTCDLCMTFTKSCAPVPICMVLCIQKLLTTLDCARTHSRTWARHQYILQAITTLSLMSRCIRSLACNMLVGPSTTHDNMCTQ